MRKMKEICFPNVKFVSFYEAVATVCCCCWGVAGGVWGSCFFSAIAGLSDEEELLGFVSEPFHEEFVGVVGGFVVGAAGVEGFCIKEKTLVNFNIRKKIEVKPDYDLVLEVNWKNYYLLSMDLLILKYLKFVFLLLINHH